MIGQCVMMTCAGFISGMILYSYWLPLIFFHVDIREVSADRNPGSSNVIRALGLRMGLLCMALDIGKAFVPVFIAVQVMEMRDAYLVPVAVAPVAGHAFSPLLRFSGGKAVSTTYGSLLGLIPLSCFVLVPALSMAFFRFVAVVRPDSLGVVAAMIASSLVAVLWVPDLWLKGVVVLISGIVVFRQLRHPDSGDCSVSIWHYRIQMQDNRLVIVKCSQ